MQLVVQLEETCRSAVFAFLCRVYRTKRPCSLAHHGDSGETDPLNLPVADSNALRLPSHAIAFDVDVAVPIRAPRVNGQEKAVTGIAIARLKLSADVTGE